VAGLIEQTDLPQVFGLAPSFNRFVYLFENYLAEIIWLRRFLARPGIRKRT
jgi:hypothetical protein